MKITLDVSGSELVLLGDLGQILDPMSSEILCRYRFIPSCRFFGPTTFAFKVHSSVIAFTLAALQRDAADKVCTYYSKNYPHLTFTIKDVDYDYK